MTESGLFAPAVPGTIPDAFRAAVERFGDRRALETEDAALTYAELDVLTNRIAHGLLARGGDEPVAMVAPLEAASVIVMLGALKAGRVFAPLDPRDPPDRVQLILQRLGTQLVSADDAIDGLAAARTDDPSLSLDPRQPSLVNFTSGSTGRPKGTIKSHRQLSWAPIGCGVAPDDRFAITLPLSFGAGHAPVLGALLAGACGSFFDPIEHGVEAMADWLADAGVTIHMTSPSALRATATALETRGRVVESVRLVILGGERCEAQHLEVARRVLPRAVMTSVYGSTEAGFIASTSIEPGEPLADGPIPLAQVFPWHSVDVVDEAGRPLPVGETGEIVVRGPDIALGYWDGPEEEARRFFSSRNGRERSVRTGDRGRLRPDGTLEHLGRVDLRVKVHGQMVDLQAVEHSLVKLPSVRDAVVSAVRDADGDTRLVAHVLAEDPGGCPPTDLRAALAEKLPPFMIPSAFLPVGAIPRNVWGKVDREGLGRAAEVADYRSAAHTRPLDLREAALVEIVTEVLGVEEVAVSDDVFALGLDSFALTWFLVAIEERLGVRLTPLDVYQAPTIEALALQIDAPHMSGGVVRQLDLSGSGTPFFCVPGGDFRIRNLLPLARLLERPTYSFVPRGFERRALPDRSVERVAARFVGALRTVRPSGPYLVGGYSFGCVIAFEMAQQLRSAGETVSLLALLDPTWQSLTVEERIREFAVGSAESRRAPLAVATRIARQLGISAGVRARVATAGIVARPYASQCRVFFALSGRMGRRYRTRPYDGHALLVTAQDRQQSEPVEMAEFLTGRTDVAEVPGRHDTILHEPFVTALARSLEEALAAVAVRQPAVV